MSLEQGYSIQNNEYGPGKCLVLKGNWRSSFLRLFHDIKQLNSIRISRSNGFTDSSCDFLSDLPPLIGLEIYTNEIKDIRLITKHDKLAYIALQTGSKSSFDFTSFKQLRSVFLDCPSRQSLFSLPNTVENGNFVNTPHSDLAFTSACPSLSKLKITGRKLLSLTGIDRCTHLTHLDIFNAPHLSNITDVQSCHNVKLIDMTTCKSFGRLDPVGKLANLQSLSVNNCGHIQSLIPLINCKRLSYLSFIEDTNIMDGDIRQLRKIPDLNSVRFANRKHYNATTNDFKCS